MPQVSVIVPCYNQSQYLDECLHSVLNQSFTDWECIIVDDGSPDNTEDIAKAWELKDPRFKYLKKQNGGVSSARNFGIEKAHSEWILPLDGDDRINTDYLKLAAEHFAANPAIIYCDGEYFGTKTGKIPAEIYDKRMMLRKNLIFCTAFFQKKDWEKSGGFDTNMKHGLEDWEFWINLLKNNSKLPLKLNYTGFFYRIKEVSRNTTMTDGRDAMMINYIVNKHKDLYEQQFGTYFNLVNKSENLKQKMEDLYQSKSHKLYTKLTKWFR